MNESLDLSPIVRAVTVPVGTQRAFTHFVEDLGQWWPRDYTWSNDLLQVIAIEPRAGGHCFELGRRDFRLDWGIVLDYDEPHRLRFTWQINPDRTPQPDPARAGEVEVRFVPETPRFTRVSLQHSGFERCGRGGAEYRAQMDSGEGWTYIMASYAGYCDIPTSDL